MHYKLGGGGGIRGNTMFGLMGDRDKETKRHIKRQKLIHNIINM